MRDELLLTGLAGHEASVDAVEHGALQTITDGIVEEGNAVVLAVRCDLVGVRLDGHLALVHRGVHIPAFAEDDDGRIDLVERGADFLHGFGVDQAHKVESEAIHVVVLRPIGHRIDDVFAHHLTFGGRIVAAAGVVDQRTVGVIAEVVTRNRLVERVVRRIVDMVVHHIHDDADVVLMQFLDHLLHFGDTGARVGRIGGIRAFRHVVVLRIVAPVLRAIRVVAQVAGLIDETIIVHRHDLHMADAQLLQVVKAGGGAFLRLRAGFHDTQVLALLVCGNAGIRVDGEVANVHFRDGGVSGLAEGRHALAGGSHILLGQHHGTLAIGDRGGGVRIGGGVDRAIGESELVGVCGAGSELLHRGAPHALVFAGHIDGLVDFGVRIGGLVDDELYLGGGRSPHLETGPSLLEGSAQIVAIIGVCLVEGVGTHQSAGDGRLRAHALDLNGVLAGDGELLGGLDLHRALIDGDVLNIDLVAIGVLDGHHGLRDGAIGRLLRQTRGQFLEIGDLSGLKCDLQRRTGGIHRGIAADQPHFGGSVAVCVEYERVGRDHMVGVIRVFGSPCVRTVPAQHADVGIAIRVAIGVIRHGILRDLAPIVMGIEGGVAAVPIARPGPDIPLRHGHLGVLGIVVEAVIAVVMHGDVHGIGLAIVVGGSGVEGFHCGGFALALVLGAVDPHFCGAGLIDRGLTVTTVLVPVLGGDDEAEIGEFAIEVERRHLAPAIGSGERMVRGRDIGSVSGGAPHVYASLVISLCGLVVHYETGLLPDGLGIADGQLLAGHTDLDDTGVGMVVASTVRVLPLIRVGVMEHEVDLLALRIDGGTVIALLIERHVGFWLVPVVAKTIVHLRGFPCGIRGLVIDGDGLVGGRHLVVDFAYVRIGRIGRSGGGGMRGLGGTCIQRDRGTCRNLRLDLAALDGHRLGAVHCGIHVAVFAVGEGRRIGDVLLFLAVVDGDETTVVAGEGDVVAAVILPIGHFGVTYVIMEGDHAAGGGPTLLAVPCGVVRGAFLVHIHVRHGSHGGARRTVIIVAVIPLVVGEQSRRAVIVGEHKRVGQLIFRTVLVGERALVAGGVPVGDEHVGVLGGQILAQSFVQSFELGDLVLEVLVHFRLEAKLGHGAVLHIVARLDTCGFGGIADDLLNPVDVIGVLVNLLGELLLDGLHAVRVDVLDGVHTEATYAKIPQLDEIVGLDVLHLLVFGVEVPHGAQAAFLHFLLIGVVGDVLVAAVEVCCGDAVRILLGGESRVVAGGTVVFASSNAGLFAFGHIGSGGLVQNHIGDDVNAGGAALLDHVCEFRFGAEFGVKLVAHRLVARPPLGALDGFLRRRYFDVAHAFGTICFGAFLGDRVPCLLERDDLHILFGADLRVGLRLGHNRRRDQRGARHGCGGSYCHHTAKRPVRLNDHCSPFSSVRPVQAPMAGSATGNVCAMDIRIHADDSESTRR